MNNETGDETNNETGDETGDETSDETSSQGPLPAHAAPLWRWPALCRALGVAAVDGPDVSGISIDTRSLRAGDLFVALSGDPGPRFNTAARSSRDGHDFLAAAAQGGAAGALVDRARMSGSGPPHRLPCLGVADTLDGLWALGRAGRARSAARVVAVTGSSGKTTLKTLLMNALGAAGSAGSFNNHLGVPLTLARLPQDAPTAVVEIGTYHPGEIAPLAAMVAPHIAVVLNVLPAHIGNFADIAALRAEKLSITAGLPLAGTLILPAELATHVRWPGRCITFGEATGDVQVHSDGATARLRYGGDEWAVTVPGGGAHRGLSCAAACAVAVALGVPMAPFVARLGTTELPVGRGNRMAIGGVVIVDDSYNANPVSMGFALRTLAAQPAQRRIALLGDILELGDQERALHAGLDSACIGMDAVICVGPRMASLYERLPERQRAGYFSDPERFDPEAFAAQLATGDTVLVKGSNMIFWARDIVPRLMAALTKRLT